MNKKSMMNNKLKGSRADLEVWEHNWKRVRKKEKCYYNDIWIIYDRAA